MTTDKLRPCPVCRGKAQQRHNHGKDIAACVNTGCVLQYEWIDLAAWQAIPRMADAVEAVVQDIQEVITTSHGAIGNPPWFDDLEKWVKILEPCANWNDEHPDCDDCIYHPNSAARCYGEECPDHPEAVCGECAVCDKHKELVACYTCHSKAGRGNAELEEANTFLKSEVKRRGRVAADAQFKPCDKCAKWEKDYITLEADYAEGKKKVSESIMEQHVARRLHEYAVHEREEMAKEVERLKIRLDDLQAILTKARGEGLIFDPVTGGKLA